MHPNFPTVFIVMVDKHEIIHQIEVAEVDLLAAMDKFIVEHKPVMTIITKYSMNHDSIKMKFDRFVRAYKLATHTEAIMEQHIGGMQ